MMENNLLSFAQALHGQGFIPIHVQYGQKGPKQPGWQVMRPTKESLARDFARPSNLGVRCGDEMSDGTRLIAIDLDLDNGPLIRCIEKAIGEADTPVKRGKKGATYFVRVDYEQKSIKLKLSRDGNKIPAIDVLGLGAQTVLPPSIHPDTNLPYRWIAGKPLHEVDYRTLRVYGPELIDEIRGFCAHPDDPIYALNDMDWRGVGGGGNTHDTCLAAVMAMVRRGWSDSTIHDRVYRAKREACEHAGAPLNWPDAQKTVQEWIESAKVKVEASPPKAGKPSHGVLADAFLPQARDHFLYDRERCCWFHFDGVCWRQENDYRLLNAIDRFLSGELRNSPMIAGIERSLRHRHEFTMLQSTWDPDFHLFNTPAGTVDLRSGNVQPHNPRNLITRCSAVAPADGYDGARWLTKLIEWFGSEPEELRYVQKLAGLFLIGGNPASCLPMWIGPGGDGKSVITNIFRYILGDYARTSTDTAFLESRNGGHVGLP